MRQVLGFRKLKPHTALMTLGLYTKIPVRHGGAGRQRLQNAILSTMLPKILEPSLVTRGPESPLGRTAAKPEQCIWKLAQRMHGWGRIQTVERLAQPRTPGFEIGCCVRASEIR